jgi:ATP-dependent protease ClpP protease subunit
MSNKINWGEETKSKRSKHLEEKKKEKVIKQLNDDDDDNGDGGLGGLFNLAMPKSDELICREGNHIYFWDEVNTENVLKFTKILRKVDYQLQCSLLKGDITEANIYLHFNSLGGSLTDGFSMASSIKKCHSKTIAIVEGCVASATTLPVVCCNHRQMQKYSYLLIHQLRTGFWGTYDNLLDETESCRDMMKMLSDIYLEHTKIPKKVLQSILKRELMLNSQTCLKYKIVDELI